MHACMSVCILYVLFMGREREGEREIERESCMKERASECQSDEALPDGVMDKAHGTVFDKAPALSNNAFCAMR